MLNAVILTFCIRNIKVMEQMIPLENDKVKTKKEERVISYSFKQSSTSLHLLPSRQLHVQS